MACSLLMLVHLHYEVRVYALLLLLLLHLFYEVRV
jgi:hypothetical protein